MTQPPEPPRPEESLLVAVCQLPAELEAASDAWQRLCETTSHLAPDLLLLGEMPFGPWVSTVPTFDSALWRRTLDCHDAGLARLDDLGAGVVAATRPRETAGRRLNEAFVWSRAGGIEAVCAKRYFPDEPGYYEARWFDRDTGDLATVRAAGLDAGFLICTELMFNEHARAYGRAAWRITWWNPVTGAENRLVGRRVGSEIVQTGSDADGKLVRWRFDAVGPETFHWKGERSEDGGATWVLEAEFSARRRPA